MSKLNTNRRCAFSLFSALVLWGLISAVVEIKGQNQDATSIDTSFGGSKIAFNGETDQSACDTMSTWTEPVNLGPPVNSPFFESAATLSGNGLSLYFVSNRPGGLGSGDIWVAQRACADCEWQPPVNLTVVNSSGPDGGPSLSVDGHLLFFHSNRPGGHGGSDIWMSRRADPNDDFGWEPPVNLGPDVNTADEEFGADYVQQADIYAGAAPASAAALYFSRGIFPNVNLDFYTVAITRDGEPLGTALPVSDLNSGATDTAPSVRTDGKEVVFTSVRSGGVGLSDIWVSTRQSADERWSPPENVGPPVNTTFNDQRPNLSRGGRTLLFDSDRPGGEGGQDIWMSTRRPGCR